MKAIIPSKERYRLYDSVIAKDVETVANFSKYFEDKKNITVGMKYDGGIDTKYIFQIMKIYYNCVKGNVIIYVEAPRKLFKELKEQNKGLKLKKLNIFNKKDILYIMKPSFLKENHKNEFSKERFYTPDLIQDIWYEYYEPSIKEITTDDI